MAEDQVDRRKDYLKDLAPWTKLFSAFKIALDPKKLLLAGGGLLVMSLGWYVLSVIFFSASAKYPPKWNASNYPDSANEDTVKRNAEWQRFKRDRHQWYLLYEMAGTPPVSESTDGKKAWVAEPIQRDAADVATTPEELANPRKDAAVALFTRNYVPYGRFRILPWFEDRGPNPYLLVTDPHSLQLAEGDRGFVGWLLTSQLPVLLEPLVKFFQPIVYMFDPAAGFWNRIYLFLLILWSMATWAIFGGAITRIAAVQIARPNDRISLAEAVKFVLARYKSYFTAPLFPLLFLFVLTIVLLVFGLLEAWTFAIGDIVFPILWPMVLLFGLIMAVVVVGLVGWPLMYATISAEGSDSFDAISRSYSYVYQAPWHYIWYSFVALLYGAVVVFFIGFMGSLTVYLGKWAATLPPTMDQREPSYLFRWAPTSFGWRNLLLHKSPHAELHDEVGPNGQKQVVTDLKDYAQPINWHNNIGSFFVSVWLYLLFLLIVGFGYSYFWTASTIIYLLMRQKVDDTEMDEIHMEEEPEQQFPLPPSHSPSGPEPVKADQAPQMVEAPQLRTPLSGVPAFAPATGQPPNTPTAEPAGEGPRPDRPM